MIWRPVAARRILLAGLMVLSGLLLAPSSLAQSTGALERYPLSPPDTSSPQATLATFLYEAGAAIEAYQAGDFDRMHARVDRLFQTLSVVYPMSDAQFLRGLESALQLLEILIRIDLPPEDQIPGAGPEAATLPTTWTIPHTEIRLVSADGADGRQIGYRFSEETIARLPDFFERVREFPVKAEFSEFEGVAERFRLRPGFAAPSFVVSYVQSLPATWFETFGGEPWWKWTALAISVLTVLAVFALVYRVASLLHNGIRPVSGFTALLRPVLILVAMLLVVLLRYVTVDVIRLSGTQRAAALGVASVLTHGAAIWLIFIVSSRAAAAVIHFKEMGIYALDAQLVRLVSKLVAVLLAIYVLTILAEKLGVPVAPLLAGLGVGGLAVALAVRPTIENIFAGFVLFADSPVRVGEFCQFGDKMGTIESIGLRSVQVRGLDRTLITVPNADFSQLQLVNFTRRDAILLQTRLQLRYDTTPDQLRLVLARLRELLIKHPRVSPDPARVRFVEYSASSLDLEVFAFVQTREFSEFLAIQEDINLRIKDIVEASGSGFAFPSQTLYVEQSSGIDADLTEAAELEVQRWRSENRLPFPDYDERTRSELSNTLDYPPEGSIERSLPSGP